MDCYACFMSLMKREGLARTPCQNLSGQTERPVVRLLNAFDRRHLDIKRLMVGYGVHHFRVLRWHFDDNVAFAVQPGEPDVYLFRELALEVEVQGIACVLWLCDELNIEEAPSCLCPMYGDEWTPGQRARLSLLFGQPVEEGSVCFWVRVPEDDLTLWLNGYPLKA